MAQNQGDWQDDYCLKSDEVSPIVLASPDVGMRSEGWLSNSRVAVHANPRRSKFTIAGQSSPSSIAEVITSPDELVRCREWAVL